MEISVYTPMKYGKYVVAAVEVADAVVEDVVVLKKDVCVSVLMTHKC
jgi:hypothetical protein